MFNNIGSKIKTLAKVIFWITLIAAIIAGTLTIVQEFGNVNNTSGERTKGLITGIGIIIGGFLGAWIGNFILYGFGELIDSNQKILKLLEEKNGKKGD